MEIECASPGQVGLIIGSRHTNYTIYHIYSRQKNTKRTIVNKDRNVYVDKITTILYFGGKPPITKTINPILDICGNVKTSILSGRVLSVTKHTSVYLSYVVEPPIFSNLCISQIQEFLKIVLEVSLEQCSYQKCFTVSNSEIVVASLIIHREKINGTYLSYKNTKYSFDNHDHLFRGLFNVLVNGMYATDHFLPDDTTIRVRAIQITKEGHGFYSPFHYLYKLTHNTIDKYNQYDNDCILNSSVRVNVETVSVYSTSIPVIEYIPSMWRWISVLLSVVFLMVIGTVIVYVLFLKRYCRNEPYYS